MVKSKAFICATLVLSLFLFAAGVSLAQAPAQETQKEPFRITVEGKIQYMKDLGGYYIQGSKPRNEFMIVNQDPKVLKKFMESKKTVTAEGTLRAAEFLTIETIDGKKYSGKPAKK
ncbi:MAG: hypothetical protein LLG97_13155 [Deltaproteobacteria bacterium]|nr:hypothetical protein [Deltaproteobacteria bacterium]